MAEINEVLLKKNDKIDYYENCPGCKIDKLKQTSDDLPYKHLVFLFIVVLAAGTLNLSLNSHCCVCQFNIVGFGRQQW